MSFSKFLIKQYILYLKNIYLFKFINENINNINIILWQLSGYCKNHYDDIKTTKRIE